MTSICIIGSGLAGYSVAKEFRKLDAQASLTVITQDDGAFYSKPQLSAALTNHQQPDDLPIALVDKLQEQWRADILTHTTALSIDATTQQIKTSATSLSYDQCVLAMGASVIRPVFPGVEFALSINNLQDYRVFRHKIVNKKRILIIGAGLIGCEFAHDLSGAGYRVDVVAMGEAPLDTFIPTRIGLCLAEHLEPRGITWHFGQTVSYIEKENEYFVVTLQNGAVLQVDVVLSAIGIRPDLTLATTAHLKTNRGIVVNAHFATSAPHLFALGDCIEYQGRVSPFIAPIILGASCLAKTLSGTPTPVIYPVMPIVVKTPSYPITFVIPATGIQGEWHIEQTAEGIRAKWLDETSRCRGFILTGAYVKERITFVKEVIPKSVTD